MKKLLSTAVMGCFLLTQPMGALAAASKGDELTDTIEKAKEILVIDSNFWNDFDYNAYENADGTRWNLNWRSTQDDSQWLNAEVDQDGHIYSYTHYIMRNQEGLAQLRRASAQANSDSFLRQVLPDVYAEFVLTDDVRGSSNEFSFTYQQMRDGVPIKDALAYIAVNKYDGTISSYYLGRGVALHGETFPQKSGVLSLSQAQKALEKEIGVELIYRSVYDYKTKETTIFPMYRLVDESKVIDAKSGKALTLSQQINEFATMDSGAGDNAVAKSADLSPEELKAVEHLSSLITKEAADSAVRALIGNDLNGYVLNSASLNKDRQNRYQWRLNYKNGDDQYAYAAVDAQSRQVLSYSNYDAANEETSAIDGTKIAQDFLAKAAPQQLKECQLLESDSEKQTYFAYQRIVNGIAFIDNGITISIDSKGKIISYNLNWLFDGDFPSVNDVKTPAQAIAQMSDIAQYQLFYVNDKTPLLVYDFADDASVYLNPFTLERINWRGESYTAVNIPAYQWQSSHRFIEYAEKLRENGIYLNESQLAPEAPMTQKQLLTLLYRARYPYDTATEEQIYDNLINWQLITKSEKAPEALLSRQDGAKYLIRFLGYDKLAQKSQLFNYPYNDTAAESERGYLALAGGLGLLMADENNHLNPESQLTIIDGFYAVYQTLNQ